MARRGSRHVNQAIRYAERCVEGRQDVGIYVRKACQRFLADLERKDLVFDPDAVIRVVEFKERLPHVKGEWMGQPFVELPWQKFKDAAVFGFYRESDGRRRTREVYNEVPRKNGKSFDMALTCLYMQVADFENSAEIYCGASTEKQAREVFEPARRVVERDAAFRDYFGLEVFKKSIVRSSDNALFQPVVGTVGDGPSPHLAVVDEYHEAKQNNVYKTFQTGMGSRADPILWIVTTAGDNVGGPCYEKRQEAIQILDGVFTDRHADSVFVLIYTLDTEDLVGRGEPADDWKTVKALKKCNPSYNKAVSGRWLRDQQLQAIRSSKDQGDFQKKHLNLWVGAATRFLNFEKWKTCGQADLDLEDYVGKRCFMAVDLANRIDFLARVLIFPEVTDEGLVYTWFPKFWLPRDAFLAGKYDQLGWEDYITLHEGVEINTIQVKKDLTEDLERFNPIELIFDPWKSSGYEQELEGIGGAEIVRFGQTQAQYKTPMDELMAAHLGGRIVHGNDPVLNWMASNLVARRDQNGNEMPNRKEKARKIDGMTSGIMAMGRALAHHDEVLDLADFKVIS